MAKKATAKRTAAKTEKTEAAKPSTLVKDLMSEGEVKHLEGLDQYFRAQKKADLKHFVDESLAKLRDFSDDESLGWRVTEAKEAARKFEDTDEHDYNNQLMHTGQIVSHLNHCLEANQ